MPNILAIDQGTTSSRALIFNEDMKIVASAQQEFEQHFPRSGWVEHEPSDIWQSTLATCREVMAKANVEPSQVNAIGITNQRETTLIWDRKTGQPIHRAIVWQDRRTADMCARLKNEGHESLVSSKTGLLLDPYFSGTKIAWLLDNVSGAREAAVSGRLAFGTVDTYLLWCLTAGQVHATDATNASRTLLYNIETGQWDDDLLKLLDVPRELLPEVRDSAADFGTSAVDIFGCAIPIAGMAGDQQAASVGQACFSPGMLKSTYGTGCFALLNTGTERIASSNRLLTTVAYQLDGVTTYALEGSIFVAGAAVQWLRDGLRIIDDTSQSGTLAATSNPNEEVYLVPAFVGLGAPYWDAECRGAMFGLTRNTGPAEIARAALESVAYQTRDLLEAMKQDWSTASATVLRVDGGMVSSQWTMQRLADILNAPVDQPTNLETTAQGAAYLAGRQVGIYPDLAEFSAQWTLEKRFEPMMDAAEREQKYAGWRDAVRRTLSHVEGS